MSVENGTARFRGLAKKGTAQAIILFARFVTAVRAIWLEVEPMSGQSVFFANHASNGDFILIWTALPPHQRAKTRPVATAVLAHRPTAEVHWAGFVSFRPD